MLLNELAERSGVSVASIKYYRREGLLPAGDRVTATRQSYGRRHLDRLELIRVLRETAEAPVGAIAHLLSVIDDPDAQLVDALAVAQALAAGLPAPTGDPAVAADEDPLVGEMIAALGWPDVATAPRAVLDPLVRSMRTLAVPVDADALLRYGTHLGAIAQGDLDDVGLVPAPAPGDSVDVLVTRAVVGMVAYERLARVVRALAHASVSIARLDPGRSQPVAGAPVSEC